MLKYTIEYVDRLDGRWRVEIDSPSYSGESIPLIPADNPVIKQYLGNNDDDIFKMHVISSSLTISVVNTGLDIRELMNINDASYKCRLYYNGILDWQGYIVSDNIQQIDSGVPYDVTIRAIDGLDVLDNSELRWNNLRRINIDGNQSALRCILNAVRVALYDDRNLGNVLPIRWNTSLKNDKYPNSDMMAGLTQINSDGWATVDRDDSAHWWIDNLSKSALSWVYQRSGVWYVDNYFDSLDGNFDGYEILDDSDTAMAYNGVSVTPISMSDTVNENWFWFVKKPLGKVNVTYNSFTLNNNSGNVIVNSEFTQTLIGDIFGWTQSYGGMFIEQEEGITERGGYSAKVDNRLFGNKEDGYLIATDMPLDTDVLYKECSLGLVWLPLQGYPLNEQGNIDFTKFPMHISVKYEFDNRELYLNEFGYWSDKNAPANSEITRLAYSETSPIAFIIEFNDQKNFFPGDRFVATVKRGGGIERYEVVFYETMDVIGGINYLATQIPNSGSIVSGKTFRILSVDDRSSSNAYMDKIDDYYKKIEFSTTAPLKQNDVLAWQFQSRGTTGDIKIPKGKGKLSFQIYSKANTVMQIADVYFNVNNAKDVYTISVPSSKNSHEEYSMQISSGYSGNMVTSYGDSTSTVNESEYWDSGKTLTQIYGEHIMSVRERPNRVFSGSIDKVVEWGLFELDGIKYAPLSMSLNTRDLITDVVGVEFIPVQSVYQVEHKSSSD